MGMDSVVINDFNVFRAAVCPTETGSITAQCFQAVPRWNPQVVEPAGDLELPQLAAGHSLEGLKARD
jgi:hypothetical protein